MTKNDPKLCNFSKVELSVSRLKLIKIYFKKSYLDYEETIFLKALLWRTEAAENKLLHIKSIIEKSLLKSPGKR